MSNNNFESESAKQARESIIAQNAKTFGEKYPSSDDTNLPGSIAARVDKMIIRQPTLDSTSSNGNASREYVWMFLDTVEEYAETKGQDAVGAEAAQQEARMIRARQEQSIALRKAQKQEATVRQVRQQMEQQKADEARRTARAVQDARIKWEVESARRLEEEANQRAAAQEKAKDNFDPDARRLKSRKR